MDRQWRLESIHTLLLSWSIPLDLIRSIPFWEEGCGSTQDVIDGPHCIYNPIMAMGFFVNSAGLRGKHYRHPIAVMGVADTFGFSCWKLRVWCLWIAPILLSSLSSQCPKEFSFMYYWECTSLVSFFSVLFSYMYSSVSPSTFMYLFLSTRQIGWLFT